MPANALIHFPENATPESVKAFMDDLAQIAAGHGMTTASGPKAKRGNIRELLQAIVGGEIALVLLVNDYSLDGDELADLRRMCDEAHPYTAELLSSVITATEDAIRRREE